MVNIKNCVLCNRPKLNSKLGMDIVVHLAAGLGIRWIDGWENCGDFVSVASYSI